MAVTVTDHHVVDAMCREGGSFVQALGGAFRRADPGNFQRLRLAFPDYWLQYKRVAVARLAEENGHVGGS